MYYLYSPTDEEIWEEIMQEVREEQARRKAEGKTAKYKSLKKRRSRKRGCSSNTDIAPEEDRKKAENNEVGCSSGTNIAAEEDIKNNKQQGGIFPKDGPQVDSSSSSNTKVGSGKFRRQASPRHAHLSPVPSQTHQPVSQGLTLEGEEKKGVQKKENLHKTVSFQIDKQPEVLHPVVDDEEVVDSLSVFPQKVSTGKQFSLRKMKLQQKRGAFPRGMKIHVSSLLFSSPLPPPPHAKGTGAQF